MWVRCGWIGVVAVPMVTSLDLYMYIHCTCIFNGHVGPFCGCGVWTPGVCWVLVVVMLYFLLPI